METNIGRSLWAVIFAGGGGTRLWPLSRDAYPKQFLKLFGNRTLLQQTYDRTKEIIPPERVFVITTTQAYAREVRRQLPQIPKSQIIAEPMRRNTAMAAALSVVLVEKQDPAGIIVNLWADQLIHDKTAFAKTLVAGAKAAADGRNLVTTGVKPTFPHTGLGYIKKGRLVNLYHGVSVFELEKFTEKPDLPTAKKMVASGSYLWNVGLFIWRVDAIIAAFKKHAQRFYPLIEELREGLGKRDEMGTLRQVYKKAPETSIDYVIAEKARNFLVVSGEFDWTDIGDFSVIWDLLDKDKNGNAILSQGRGQWLGIDTKESLIVAFGKKLVGTVGISDLIVVVKDDSILVAPKSQAQRVKELVNELKKQKKKEYL